jgi:hypothetical protein
MELLVASEQTGSMVHEAHMKTDEKICLCIAMTIVGFLQIGFVWAMLKSGTVLFQWDFVIWWVMTMLLPVVCGIVVVKALNRAWKPQIVWSIVTILLITYWIVFFFWFFFITRKSLLWA